MAVHEINFKNIFSLTQYKNVISSTCTLYENYSPDILHFFYIKISKSSVYFLVMKHLGLDATFSLEILDLRSDFIKRAAGKAVGV